MDNPTTYLSDTHRRTKPDAVQGSCQLEQTEHASPNDIEEDPESSTRAVATGFPPDTTEATMRKFLQDVLQKESLTGQVTQIRYTADSTTHAFLMFNTKSEWNHFVRTLRRSQHVGEGSTKPMQCLEDLSWEARNIHKQLGYAKCHSHREMGTGFRRSSSTEQKYWK